MTKTDLILVLHCGILVELMVLTIQMYFLLRKL